MSDPNQPDPTHAVPPVPPAPPAYPPPPPAYPGPGGAYETPSAPAYGQPQYGQPPAYGQTQYGQPQYGQYGQYGATSPYAHWGSRVAASLLDGILFIPAYIVGVVGLSIASGTGASSAAQAIGIIIGLLGYLGGVGFSVWNQIIRQGKTGQSLGKQWMSIRLISEQTGQPIGGWPTLGRAFVHILDGLPCYIGYLWPLWDDKRQTFADKIMNTIVVPAPKVPDVQYAQPPYPTA